MRSAINLIIFLCFTIALPAHAVVEQNKTVISSGVRPGVGGAYFRVKETLTTTCSANVIWINFDQTGTGKAAYSTVLAAHMSGRILSYLEYSTHSNGNCYLIQVEVTQ